MKNKPLLISFMIFAVLTFASCGSGESKVNENSSADSTKQAPKELTDMINVNSYYECPMKCEGKKFSEPGNCPTCGMELVLIETTPDSTVVQSDTTHQM